ncbi:protein YIPF6-like [Hydractinia symbiolongicarpus]|uniref:protein YIPF6-like n=1 Tax=Hydractinia symbiolongicarpus TaxID=13093 RepID=UPI002550F47A|nr:protein YIPF6-like [Hydractinia symbiolongicarpus]
MADDVVGDNIDFHQTEENSVNIEGDIHVAGVSSDDEDASTLDEPISATLKRDLRAIGKKFFHVVIPKQSTSLLRDWDLWGPLILCIILATLLQSSHDSDGSPEFAQVFVIVWIGASVVTVNSKLLGGTISFFQSLCVLGYCILPLTLALLVCKIILLAKNNTILFAARCLVVLATLIWSCLASLAFLGDSQPHRRKPLAVYPICLFYFVISWLVLSHTG